MIATYRRVLSLPGALAFSAAGLVARLPISMVGLGIVLLVSDRTGSYAVAGTVSAAYLTAGAALAVPQGRWADRFGQVRVLPVAAVVYTLALAGLMAAVERGATGWPAHAFAALAGASLPQVGSSVRARWAHVVPERAWLQTAFAVEAVVDETIFIVGPTLVALLATLVHPLAGLGTAALAGLVGTLALAGQRGTQPPRHPRPPKRADRPRMPWPVIVPLVVAAAALGGLFGATEVATVAFAEEHGAKAASGPLLAVWALGSLLSGLATGAVTWRGPVRHRFVVGMTLLAGSMLPLPFLPGFGPMVVVLFLAGFTISPTLIALTAWTEETAPAARLTEGMSLLNTGVIMGLAPGAALAGTVVDLAGGSAGYWVSASCGGLGVAAAVLALRLWRPAVSAAAPSPTGSSA